MSEVQEIAGWQPIESAPWMKPVRIRTEAGREFIAIEGNFAVNEGMEDCSAWAEYTEGFAPDCWTDGICWEANDAGKRSDWPTHWQAVRAHLQATQGEVGC